MSISNKIEYIFQRITKTHIYHTIPRGIDYIHDIATSLPQFRANIVFDVGANVGQSALTYLQCFPGSRIYCFEPATDTFHRLQANMGGHKRVLCHHIALGSANGNGMLVIKRESDMSYLLNPSQEPAIEDDVNTESVTVIALDDFCIAERIDQISYMKIDTEGADLEVLKGASRMLLEQKIDLIEVEAGMNPLNHRHVPFEVLKKHLESYQYFLLGIYQQVNEWPTGKPQLRRTNPIFLSQRLIDLHSTTQIQPVTRSST